MKLIQVRYKDSNGKTHPQYVIRQVGAAQFEVIDELKNEVVGGPYTTAREAKDYLVEIDEEKLNAGRARNWTTHQECMKRMLPPRKPQRLFSGLVGRLPEPETPTAPAPVLGSVATAEEVMEDFGIEPKNPKPKLPDSFRTLLNLEPSDIIALWHVELDRITEFTQVDVLVSPQTIQHRIDRLMKVISASKAIVEGLSVHVMKIRRDEILDKSTREKFKTEERSRRARCNAKLFKYRLALKTGNYHEKVWRWVTKPVTLRDVLDDELILRDVTVFDENALRVHKMDLQSYEQISRLGVEALDELGETEKEQKTTWKLFRRWENCAILQAILHGIIVPRRDLFETMGLGKLAEDLKDAQDAAEEATWDTATLNLLAKTGGACWSGRVRIQSAGYRYNKDGSIAQRKLYSFERPTKMTEGEGASGYGRGENEGSRWGNWNDDAEGYDLR
jgi:hypothetical protein